MNPKAKWIKLAHFINPSRFYFRDLANEEEERQQVEKVENSIFEFVKKFSESFKATLRFYEPKAGELVAYYCRNSKKWLRCEVEVCKLFNEETTVILWAIDYATPFYTTNLCDIVPLQESFRRPKSKIVTGSLGLIPASIRFDHENSKIVKDIKDVWHDRAVQMMSQLAASTSEVYFIPSSAYSHYEISVGDLYFGKRSLTVQLMDNDLATTVPQNLFLNYYAKLFTNHIERWNDNTRSGGVLKNEFEGIPNLALEKTVTKVDEVVEQDSAMAVYNEAVRRKVLDWQARNEEMSEPEDSESIISYHDEKLSKPLLNTSPIGQDSEDDETIVDFSGIPAKQLSEMLEKLTQQEEIKKIKYHRKIIFVPAGGGMCTSDRDSSFDFFDSAQSKTTANSTIDGNFVSVSQVGSVQAQALNASAQRHSQQESYDDMMSRMMSHHNIG